jgi:hypothetical protein
MNTNNEEVKTIEVNSTIAEDEIINDTERVWDRFIRNTAIFLSSAE